MLVLHQGSREYSLLRIMILHIQEYRQGRFYHPASLDTRPGTVADLLGDP
jgi:hypothetical protein